MRFFKNGLFLGLPLMLGACGHGESLVSTTQLVSRGWARPPQTYHPKPLYCYETLGRTDCYQEPLPGRGESHRKVAFYEPGPVEPVDDSQPEVAIETALLAPVPLAPIPLTPLEIHP